MPDERPLVGVGELRIMNANLRWAEFDDATLITLLDERMQLTDWRVGQYQDCCENPRSVLLAEVDDELCGYLATSRVLDETTILALAVAPWARRKGLAAALLSEARKYWRKSGQQRCLLEVRESNQAARCLYLGLGFLEDGMRKDYYPGPGGRENAILMSLDLNEGSANECA
jgi:ribosomal-protein-alanine N-acetyltransferase